MRTVHGCALVAAGLFVCRGAYAAGAPELPATLVRYDIRVSLEPDSRRLDGVEEIRWKNPAAGPIDRLPLHLYLNAFENEGTTWMGGEALHAFDLDELRKVYPDPFGFIDLTRVEQVTAAGALPVAWRAIQPDDGNPLDRTLVELALPAAVAPGAELVLRVAFAARLPVPIARTGGHGDYFFVAQWYPKVGAFEPRGVRGAPVDRFAARQFRGPTEFYADFAEYAVEVTVPAGFVVAATGHEEASPASAATEGRAFRFTQRAVHDFAFVAGRNLVIETRRHLPRGRPGGEAPVPVDIHYVVPRGGEGQIARWRAIAEATLDELGGRIGAYPYSDFTLVMPPWSGLLTCGMEYPTLVTGVPGDPIWDRFPLATLRLPEEVIAHEITHNYFYGLVASNEQEEAFLDEGFTEYWGLEVLRARHGEERSGGTLLGRAVDAYALRAGAVARRVDAFREPVRKRPTGLFYPGSERSQVYDRPMQMLRTAAVRFGQPALDGVFAVYFRRFRFAHPGLADFLTVAREAGGDELEAFLREGFERDRLPDYRVVELTCERYQPPLGRVATDAGPRFVDERERDRDETLGLDPQAREDDGRVLMEVTDGGFARGADERPGSTARQRLAPVRRDPVAGSPPASTRVHESRVRLDGPGWDHLPVVVELRFDDGVVLRDAWDGRAAWRAYRFLRPACLREAVIDPDGAVAVDVTPDDNRRARRADAGFAAGFTAWLGALAGLLGEAVALWL